MSHQEYARGRVLAALDQAEGNLAQAQRLLLAWVEEDASLLRGLAMPHLRSIAGLALQSAQARETREIPKPSQTEKGGSDGIEIGAFGREILENMTGKVPPQQFGFVRDEINAPHRTSEQHIEAILQIARKDGKQ